MDHEVLTHEKVRFRREDIAPLEAMPSACVQDSRIARPRYAAKARRVLGLCAAALATLLVVFAGAAYVVSASGPGIERWRLESERALKALAGAEVDVASGPAWLSLDGSRLLGLEVADIRLTTAATGESFLQAGSLRFGLHLWPLLTGDIRMRSLRIADARIVPGFMPQTETGAADWSRGLKNASGLIEPDLVADALFHAAHRLFALIETHSTRRIQMENVELVLNEAGGVRTVRIAAAEMSRSSAGVLEFTADLDLDARKVTIVGEAERDRQQGRIRSLEITVSSPDAPAGQARFPAVRGDLDLSLTGQEAVADEPRRLQALLRVRGGVLRFGDRDTFSGDVELASSLRSGTGKIEIDRLRLTSGRSQLVFHGAVGPAPSTGRKEPAPAYRYELVSDGSRIAGADVPDPALDFVAKIYGTYLPDEHRLDASEVGLRTSRGELLATASVDFADDRTPSVILAVDVPSMPVAHVKQLWPFISAPGVRAWTLDNVFGGTVKDSWLRLSVPSGRLGNGIPLSGEEVSGFFRVEDGRFDVAGQIPPVRDAFGTVDFRGTDVDVALSQGTVFMASGRTVAASNGTFAIRDAHVKPVIGKLDIDVEGEAPDIVELASYPPIDAMRTLHLAPGDFAGRVSGHVRSDIPLSRDVAVRSLDWLVTLGYQDLSVAKPFDGQRVTEATGSIVVDPTKAVIMAQAKLNGLPANLDLVEPLETGKAERKRDIEIVLDDTARGLLAPGLNTILSGPVVVDFESMGSNMHEVTADLTEATLKLPWMGWSKGPGVPATASFGLTVDGKQAELSGFRLDGGTFGASGRISLSGGGLSDARFDRVRLNRGDSISVDLKRASGGYAVTVRGEAVDVRPLIKHLQKDAAGQGGAAGAPVHVSVDAEVRQVAGFSGEVLSNVRIAYRGTGSRTDSLTFSAVSRSGGAISANDTGSSGGRSVQMQSADAGAFLRFLNVYEHMQGGSIRLNLKAQSEGPLRGQIDARDFWVVNEPRLRSIVSTAPAGGERSLNDAVRRDIDTSSVRFERGFAQIEKGKGYLAIANGVLRGPLIGTTFRGTLYDPQGNMSVTGTFMPAYGLNRLFAEIPLIGQILGNGRDRGLIGITYKLAGNAKSPKLQVNPISVIAPGIFRSIFEFH